MIGKYRGRVSNDWKLEKGQFWVRLWAAGLPTCWRDPRSRRCMKSWLFVNGQRLLHTSNATLA